MAHMVGCDLAILNPHSQVPVRPGRTSASYSYSPIGTPQKRTPPRLGKSPRRYFEHPTNEWKLPLEAGWTLVVNHLQSTSPQLQASQGAIDGSFLQGLACKIKSVNFGSQTSRRNGRRTPTSPLAPKKCQPRVWQDLRGRSLPSEGGMHHDRGEYS